MLPEIWAYGLRNPEGLTFDPKTGELWSTDIGPEGGDEFNITKKGANYGWRVITYGIEYRQCGVSSLLALQLLLPMPSVSGKPTQQMQRRQPSDTSHFLATINSKVAIERLSAHASTISLIGYNCTNPLRGNAVALNKLLDPVARFISGHQRAISLCCCDAARHLALGLSSHLRLHQPYFALATNQSNPNPRRSTKIRPSESLALGLRSNASKIPAASMHCAAGKLGSVRTLEIARK
jgi:Glucose / Sorbosone dehydrogenase